MKSKMKDEPTWRLNFARKRNFTKFRLSGIYYTLKDIKANNKAITEEERKAIEKAFENIASLLGYWDKHYSKIKQEFMEKESI